MRRTGLAIILGIALAGTATIAAASRNSSGTYTVSASGTYPFVTGTSISSTTMNSVFSDITTELTDSASRSGKGGFLAPVRAIDGTVNAPSFSFTSETGTGWYRAGSHDMRASVNGSGVLQLNANGATITGAASTSGILWGLGGLSTNLSYSSAGDVVVARSATLGTVYFGNPANGKYIGFDGTVIQAPGAAIVNPATFLAAGHVTNTTCALASQTGSLTATGAHIGTGHCQITVAGISSSGVVTATVNGSVGVATVATVGSGTFDVYTYSIGGAPALIEADFSFVVLKL